MHRQSITQTEHQQWQHNILATYILETPVILWHKGLTFERTNSDAIAAATRRQSNAEITHVQEPKSRHVVNMVTL